MFKKYTKVKIHVKSRACKKHCGNTVGNYIKYVLTSRAVGAV